MKVLVNKRFLKDLSILPSGDRKKIEEFVFDKSEKIESIELSGVFEKLKGHHGCYRARFGDYRVGIRYENETLIFERVLHRKDIYRYFP